MGSVSRDKIVSDGCKHCMHMVSPETLHILCVIGIYMHMFVCNY